MADETRYIDSDDLKTLLSKRNHPHAIIFLSGPTSLKTPLSVLKENDVITVNGAARYLLDNHISPFIYILTDARFLTERGEDFYEFSGCSQYTIVNRDVYEKASPKDKKYIDKFCYIIRPLYKREKGGVLKRLTLHALARKNDDIFIQVPWSKKKRLVGFSKNITQGYCSCHTVAYAAAQICYSLQYEKIVFSGLDMTGGCARFYNEPGGAMPSELSRDLQKILPFFIFMKEVAPEIKIFNLSDDTAINYDVIPKILHYEVNN